MNYESQLCKQVKEQPSYIKKESLLALQRASLVRYDKKNNTLNLFPQFFNFMKPISKDIDKIMSDIAPIQKVKLNTSNDKMIGSFISGLVRSVKGLPTVVKHKALCELHQRQSILSCRTTYDVFYHVLMQADGDVLNNLAQKFINALNGSEFLVIERHCNGVVILDNTVDINVVLQLPLTYEEVSPPTDLPLLEELHTPGVQTIQHLQDFTSRSAVDFIKSVLYQYEKKLIFVAIRGDLECSDEKLRHVLGISDSPDSLELAPPELLEKHGLVGGYAGLVNMKNYSDATIIIDNSCRSVHSGVTGANKIDYHFINFNIERDAKKVVKNAIYADLAQNPKTVKGAILCEFANCIDIPIQIVGNDNKPTKVEFYKISIRYIDIVASLISRKKIKGVYVINTLKTNDKINEVVKELSCKLSPNQIIIDNRTKSHINDKLSTAEMSLFEHVIICTSSVDDDSVKLNEVPTKISDLSNLISC